jgi:hypothetical protein
VAQHLNVEALREQIEGGSKESQFEVLHAVSALAASPDAGDLAAARELTIRLLERRAVLNGNGQVLDALVRQLGLFPYLDPDDLSVADILAWEAHRPIGVGGSTVFHEVQARVYRMLMNGESVILSAPTSFGKSLIIDALIAGGAFDNAVVVVPTIALLDETRRRLSRFNSTHKIITHVSQELGERNLLVLTQERVIDFPELPPLDLFVIDEFYKLDANSDPDRGHLLNQAFYRLWKTGSQYYFLGPNIRAIPEDLPGTFTPRFVKTDYATVAANVHRVSQPDGEETALVELCRSLEGEPTLIYCRSPKRTRDVAGWLLAAGLGHDAGLDDASTWIGDNFHPAWVVRKGLDRGIGVHHGRLPRSLAHFMVRQFNEGRIQYLICTSTLIEGVNTKAKNVVIFDNKIARSNFDYFTFNNIRGRSGRMFEHFVGDVYLFHDPPHEELPFVDFPVLTQPESAPNSLLIQIDEEELSPRSLERIEQFYDHSALSINVLRTNSGLDPGMQIELAEELERRPSYYNPLLRWTYNPDWDQLKAACELIWTYLVPGTAMQSGVASGAQLAFKLLRLQQLGASAELIKNLGGNEEPDEAVEGALDFVRQWAGFRFPRLLSALDSIQREVFVREGFKPGDFSSYAVRVENLFLRPPLIALDEYGLPPQIAKQIEGLFAKADSLDEVLDAVRGMVVDQLPLGDFEKELLRDTQSSL